MGALCKNEKRVSRCMGTHFLSLWSRLVSLKGSPQNIPTCCFYMFLKLFGAPLKHPSCAHQKMDHPKWTPKSSQGKRTKHSFFELILQTLLFGIHLVAAPSAPFICKSMKKAMFFIMFLTPLPGPTWGTTRNITNCKMSATLHGSAPAKKKSAPRCMRTFSQVRWSRWVPQKGPPKNSPNSLFLTVLSVFRTPYKIHRCKTDTCQNERHAASERIFV